MHHKTETDQGVSAETPEDGRPSNQAKVRRLSRENHRIERQVARAAGRKRRDWLMLAQDATRVEAAS